MGIDVRVGRGRGRKRERERGGRGGREGGTQTDTTKPVNATDDVSSDGQGDSLQQKHTMLEQTPTKPTRTCTLSPSAVCIIIEVGGAPP